MKAALESGSDSQNKQRSEQQGAQHRRQPSLLLPHEQAIEADKIRVIRRNTRMILLGNLLGSLPISIVFWDEHAHQVVPWAMVLYSLLAGRLWHYYSVNLEQASFDQLLHYDRSQKALIFLTGCIWGVAGWWFFDASEIRNVSLMTLTFVTMIAGSLVSLSSRPLAYVGFSLPLMSPLLLQMLLADEWFLNWMSFGGLVYLAATIGFSRTIHRELDQSLRLKYENLDLIEDLREQTERANAANAEKSRFLAAASHDLRQPLQAVGLYREVLAKKVADSPYQQDLERMGKGLDSLNELLDALFDVSRLDAGVTPVNLRNFHVDELLHKLEPQFRLEASLKQLDFRIQCRNCVVRSDPVLLERVLTNLLVNAFRYTREGRVEVVCEPDPASETLTLRIRDTGIGIAAADRERIFNEFYQVHNPERDRRHGLGLGLAIVKRALSLLQHPIDVSSEPGVGSEFSIQLPLASVETAERLEPQRPDNALNLFEGRTLVLVENEADILEASVSLLQSWGCACHGFDRAEDALAAMAEQENRLEPDLMVVDYRMPGEYNGCELVQAARVHQPGIPALIITGDTSQAVMAEIERHQLDCLHKPIKPVQLRIMATRLLKKRSPLTGR